MARLLSRRSHVQRVRWLLRGHPVVGLLGARQVGKTTLAELVARSARGPVHRFDLEQPDIQALFEQPRLMLEPLRGLVILDEVQHLPDLFPLLRSLADRRPPPARFLILGSASPQLLRQGSETLAGRVAWHELPPLSLDEVGVRRLGDLWLRGGMPRSLLAASDAQSFEWRRSFVRTFLERDVPMFAGSIPPAALGRFWRMLAHWHGQTWNGSEFARAFGVAHTTVRRYLDLLSGTFVVRQLQPWHENLAKRQVKSPKVYIADAGMLHALLDIPTHDALAVHPKIGASWEGFALEIITSHLGVAPDQCFFWATHSGAEIDLLVISGRRRIGFEFKRATAPTLTPSMSIAVRDLRLDSLVVVHGGHLSYALGDRVRALPLSRILDEVEPLPDPSRKA